MPARPPSSDRSTIRPGRLSDDQELSRRLDVLSSETYSDPARRDLTRSDFAVLVAVNLALVLLMYWIAWGYR